MRINKETIAKTLPMLAAAVLCTAGPALGAGRSNFTTNVGHLGTTPVSARGGVAASCGGTELTQNTTFVPAAGTVSCNSSVTGNADNAYARNFAIASPIFVKCVDFAVEANTAATPVRVRLYTHPTAGLPVTANLTLIAGSEMMVNAPAGASAVLTATYAGSGIAVPAGNLVVELFTPCRQTACVPPGDGGSIFLGSNAAGQSFPTYLKAAACGAADFANLGTLGFPNVHILMRLGLAVGDPCQVPLPSCPADMTGPSGPNGVVNVDDLLVVINGWGGTQVPPGTGPRPLGDCAPGPNNGPGNCAVNTDDLLKVINSWGNCPVATFACCFTNGSCQVLSVAACNTAGGTPNQTSATCPPTPPCPQPVSNDECASRLPLTVSPTNTPNNAGATANQATPGGDCTFNGASNFNHDIWYTYTSTCTGTLTVSTSTTTGAVTDTVLALYSGNCTALTQVACNDDISGTNLLSTLTASVTNGTVYRLRVGTWNQSPTGVITLTFSCAVANNDFCGEATPLGPYPAHVTGTLVGATQESPAVACNSLTPGSGRWYTCIGTGNTLTAQTCDNTATQVANERISVYCGTDCNTLVCVNATSANECGFFTQQRLSWCSALNQKYWILVWTPGLPNPAEGNYVLDVTTGAPNGCSAIACTDPNAPANDHCSAAIDVTTSINGAAVDGTNVGATPAQHDGNIALRDTELPITSPSCQWAGVPTDVHNTVWYKFVAPAGGSVKIETCSSLAPLVDTTLALYSGACGSLVQVGCGEDECPTPDTSPYYSRITANGLTVGATYYILVANPGGWTGVVPGPFKLLIATVAPPSCPPTLPSNACSTMIAGNGSADGVNGTRPNVGWTNGATGVIEDMVFCHAGGATINNIRVTSLDQIAAGTGTLSTYNQLRIRIYAGDPATLTLASVPIYANDFTVGPLLTHTLCGTFGSPATLDLECWSATISPSVHVPTGTYGVYYSFPQLTNAAAPSVFIATGGGAPNDSSTAPARIFGENPPGTLINGATTQHNAFCAGGTVP